MAADAQRIRRSGRLSARRPDIFWPMPTRSGCTNTGTRCPIWWRAGRAWCWWDIVGRCWSAHART